MFADHSSPLTKVMLSMGGWNRGTRLQPANAASPPMPQRQDRTRECPLSRPSALFNLEKMPYYKAGAVRLTAWQATRTRNPPRKQMMNCKYFPITNELNWQAPSTASHRIGYGMIQVQPWNLSWTEGGNMSCSLLRTSGTDRFLSRHQGSDASTATAYFNDRYILTTNALQAIHTVK